MRSFVALIALIVGTIIATGVSQAATDSFPGWDPLWMRDESAGTARLEDEGKTIRVDHTGKRDWSLNREKRLDVKAGDIVEINARLRVNGEGNAIVCAATFGQDGKVIEWSRGDTTLSQTDDWRNVRARFVVFDNVAVVEPRIIGYGPATVWIAEFGAGIDGNIQSIRNANLPENVSAQNAALRVSLNTKNGTILVTDRRTGNDWKQSVFQNNMSIQNAVARGRQIEWEWLDPATARNYKATLTLDGDKPEFGLALAGEGPLPRSLPYPHPFVTGPGMYLVVPMNEGISYPVDDDTIRPMRLITYGGHGICMAFWGVTDGEAGQMAIIETADDAAIRIERIDGRLAIVPEWQSQKGQFGYERRLRYVFFDRGGHVAMAKRYRAYAKQIDRLKTLAEKRREIPAVDKLIGAVNTWCWDRNAPEIVGEMQAAGIDRILWSNRRSPDQIETLDKMGVLTSRYDIVQDVMNPDNFKLLRGVHSDWPTEAWPDDLMVDENGNWRHGWRVRARNGDMIPCGVLCDRQALTYLDNRMTEELKTHAYRCRFIDTTTASPWRECYDPDHLMTRADSRKYKMELLGLVSGKHKLVCGSETGHDAAVPYVHYFEGMLSLGPYRIPDAGRGMRQIWDEVPARVAKFQVGHQYRLPLWELVYHDCVVAQWYWGDYNNKLPAIWDKRDLFNALYGTPPMFMFDQNLWRKNRDRFAQSYKTIAPVALATGYSQMIDHRFLAPGRSVQQTEFANGVKVTVNFGDAPFQLADKTTIPSMGVHVEGLEASK